jgi:hypothetical protein
VLLIRLHSHRYTGDRSRLGLVLVVLLSLVTSDVVAVRHAGACCKQAAGQSGLAVPCGGSEIVSATASGCCQRCSDRDKPFRRGRGIHPGDAAKIDQPVDTAAESLPPTPEHDRDRCAVCRWLAVFSGGVQLATPVAIERQQWATVADVAVVGVPARMVFLPTVSRRGPPEFA